MEIAETLKQGCNEVVVQKLTWVLNPGVKARLQQCCKEVLGK